VKPWRDKALVLSCLIPGEANLCLDQISGAGQDLDGILDACLLKVAPKSYAFEALDDAKKDLCRDKYLVPVAFIITDDDVLNFNPQFDDREQKEPVFG
jgi:hypothetical protein